MKRLWLLAPLIICGIMVAWHYAALSRGGISWPESAVYAVLRLPQRGLGGVGGWFGDVGRTMIGRDSLAQSNRALSARVDYLEGENTRLQRYLRENGELRALLKMRPPAGGENVASEVVSLDFSAYARRIALNVGARQGVAAKDVVFTARGLVGQVIAVDRNWPPTSQVLLLTDRQSSVGAMTSRAMAKGIVQGTGENGCRMSYLDFNSDVREGDLVLTSGDSTIFPRGLIIGRVLRVWRNKTYSTMSADIEPAVAFDRLTAVFVRTLKR